MKALIFLLLFYPFVGYTQQELPLTFQKKLKHHYQKGNYDEVLLSIKTFQDKGFDNPITYKYKGTYNKNFELYNYKFKAECALAKTGNYKMLKEAMIDYAYLLSISNAEQLKKDSLIYQDFNLIIKGHVKKSYSNENWREAEINLLYLTRFFNVTIPEYRMLFEPWYGIAQEPTIAQIDSLASLPMKLSISGKLLANYLTKGLKDDNSKARAIFVWIASHIRYGWKNDITIYKSRRGVCADYALLFRELGNYAGLEVVYLTGIAKGKNYNIDYPEESLHAWNSIRINGEFKLIETTWAASSGNWNYYFCADPKSLINTHFPYNSFFQLLDEKVTFEEFVNGNKIESQ